MVYVYIANVKNLPDPLEYPELMKGLPKDRVKKIKKFKRLKDRKQSLGAGILLLNVIQRHGQTMEDLIYIENGKPVLEGICFNLSHSDDMVACAVSEKPVGIDIEKIKKLKVNISGRFFTENENKHLEEYQENEAEFFRLWTMKESYMKYTGEGIKLALNRFEISFDDGISVCRDGNRVECYIKEYNVPGYKLTVCAKENEFATDWEEVNLYNEKL